MKQNMQDIDNRLVKADKRMKRNQGNRATSQAWPVRSRLAVGLLACLLAGLVALVPFLAVREVHAQSACLILCLPTATPRPTPSPTPTPRPTPSPTAKPTATSTAKPTPTPATTPTAKPTAQASASPAPTTAATEAGQTPVTSSSHISPTSQQGPGSQPGSGNMLLISAITVSMIFLLLLALGSGWLLIRRALIPPMDTKLPPSGARPWSRFRIPNPNSLLPGTNALNTQEQVSPFSVSHAELETNRLPFTSSSGSPGSGEISSMVIDASSFLAPQSSLNGSNSLPDSQSVSSQASAALLNETTAKMRRVNEEWE